MKQRIIALLLALALTLSLCAVSALAEEQDQSQAGPETEETAGEHTGEETAEGEEAPPKRRKHPLWPARTRRSRT